MTKDELKRKRGKSQKIVIPRGSIDPNEETIIEIPEHMRKKAVVIAKRDGVASSSSERRRKSEKSTKIVRNESTRNPRYRQDQGKQEQDPEEQQEKRRKKRLLPPPLPGTSHSSHVDYADESDIDQLLDDLEKYYCFQKQLLFKAKLSQASACSCYSKQQNVCSQTNPAVDISYDTFKRGICAAKTSEQNYQKCPRVVDCQICTKCTEESLAKKRKSMREESTKTGRSDENPRSSDDSNSHVNFSGENNLERKMMELERYYVTQRELLMKAKLSKTSVCSCESVPEVCYKSRMRQIEAPTCCNTEPKERETGYTSCPHRRSFESRIQQSKVQNDANIPCHGSVPDASYNRAAQPRGSDDYWDPEFVTVCPTKVQDRWVSKSRIQQFGSPPYGSVPEISCSKSANTPTSADVWSPTVKINSKPIENDWKSKSRVKQVESPPWYALLPQNCGSDSKTHSSTFAQTRSSSDARLQFSKVCTTNGKPKPKFKNLEDSPCKSEYIKCENLKEIFSEDSTGMISAMPSSTFAQDTERRRSSSSNSNPSSPICSVTDYNRYKSQDSRARVPEQSEMCTRKATASKFQAASAASEIEAHKSTSKYQSKSKSKSAIGNSCPPRESVRVLSTRDLEQIRNQFEESSRKLEEILDQSKSCRLPTKSTKDLGRLLGSKKIFSSYAEDLRKKIEEEEPGVFPSKKVFKEEAEKLRIQLKDVYDAQTKTIDLSALESNETDEEVEHEGFSHEISNKIYADLFQNQY